MLEGVVWVAPGPLVRSAAPVSAETGVLLEYLHKPRDACVLNVCGAVYLCEDAEGLIPKLEHVQQGQYEHDRIISRATSGHFVFSPRFTDPQLLLQWEVKSRRQNSSSGLCEHLKELPAHALVLPRPLAVLAVQGFFSNLLWLARWSSPLELPRHQIRGHLHIDLFPGWPDVAGKRVAGEHVVTDGLPHLSSDALQRLARTLQATAQHLQQTDHGGGMDDEDEVRMKIGELSNSVEMLEHWALAMHSPGLLQKSIHHPSRLRFFHSSALLLNCIDMAFASKASDYLHTVKKALQVALPAEFKSMADSCTRCLPSHSTVARCRFALDLAITLRQRLYNSGGEPVKRFWKVDASPLQGREFLWLEEYSVKVDDLLRALQSLHALVLSNGDAEREFETWLDDEEVAWDRVTHTLAASDVLQAAALLQGAVKHYIYAPAVLGSARAGEVHKAAAITHMVRLNTASNAAACRVSTEVACICTDMGTESTLSFTRVPLADLLPDWCLPVPAIVDEEEIVLHGDFGGQDRISVPDELSSSFLPNAVGVAGTEHVMDNLSSELHHPLHCFASYYGELRNISLLLCRRWNRERFIISCLSHTHLAADAFRLRNWSAVLYEPRWHHVVLFLKKMTGVLHLLATFSYQAFETTGAVSDREHSFDARMAQKSLASPWFALYTHFLVAVSEVPLEIAQWSKGCPCHQWLRSRAEPVSRHLLGLHCGNKPTCVMTGCRAPELAVGDIDAVIDAAVAGVERKVIGYGVGLSAEDLQNISLEASAAAAQFKLQAQIKLDYWQRLPWVLAGCAHWHSPTAIGAATKALEAIERCDNPDSHSSVTRKWLQGPLLQDLRRFAAGTQLHALGEHFQQELPSKNAMPVKKTLKETKREIATMAFWPVNEVSIEAKHAHASIASKRNQRFGPVLLSLSNRWQLLHSQLGQSQVSDTELLQLLDALDVARVPHLAVEALGLGRHHMLVSALALDNTALARAGIKARARKDDYTLAALKTVYYRNDLDSMFECWSHEAKDNQRKRLLEKQKELDSAQLLHKRPLSYKSLTLKYRLEHFRLLADTSCFYSTTLPLDSSQLSVHGLADYFAQKHDSHYTGGETIYFRILKTRPSAQKQMPVAAGARPPLRTEHLAVHVHARRKWTCTDEVLVSAVQSGDFLSGPSIALMDGLLLLESPLWQWRQAKHVLVHGKDKEPSLDEVELLTEMAARVQATAVTGETRLLAADLADRGVLERTGEDVYSLIPEQFSSLHSCFLLGDPLDVLKIGCDIIADCTTYQLISMLEAEGWSWQSAPSQVRAKQHVQSYLYPSAAKIWYSGSAVRADYLRCLLQAEAAAYNCGLIYLISCKSSS
eukprot:6157697-Amphidinium_carterae.1